MFFFVGGGGFGVKFGEVVIFVVGPCCLGGTSPYLKIHMHRLFQNGIAVFLYNCCR